MGGPPYTALSQKAARFHFCMGWESRRISSFHSRELSGTLTGWGCVLPDLLSEDTDRPYD
jgi:hypothetical protein